MTGTGLKVRDRKTDETFEAHRVAKATLINDEDAGESFTTPAGSVLVLTNAKDPDDRTVRDVYRPDEMDAFGRRYEVLG